MFNLYSFDNCGESKHLDASVLRITLERFLLCHFHRRQRILHAFFGAVGCFPGIHSIGKGSPSTIYLRQGECNKIGLLCPSLGRNDTKPE